MNASHRRTRVPVTRRNAQFQQWQTLLTNRTKRLRMRRMLVQGVRPITLALEHGHRIVELLVDPGRHLSRWARDVLQQVDAAAYDVAPELLGELGERESGPPELLAVVEMPADGLSRLTAPTSGPIVVFDRPANPGNIGSLARSIDALGGAGLVVTGHSADPWDPASVRASTGSIFAIDLARAESPDEVVSWVEQHRQAGLALPIIGTDETGTVALSAAPLGEPAVVVIGSEATGMSAGWRSACDEITSIPMTGSASSLNAASAGSIVLYEALRQRTS